VTICKILFLDSRVVFLKVRATVQVSVWNEMAGRMDARRPSVPVSQPSHVCETDLTNHSALSWTPKPIYYINGFVCVMCVRTPDFVATVFSLSTIQMISIHRIREFQILHIVCPCPVRMLRREALLDGDVQQLTQCQPH